MKTWACLLACAAVSLGAGAATAQIDPNPDGIGIYADLGGLTNSIQAEPNEAIEVYLLATRTTHTMLGAEFKITPPANAFMWGFATPFGPGGIMNLTDGGMMVAFTAPQPASDVMHVLTFIIRMLDAEAGYFYIGPTSVNSGGFDAPVYASDPPSLLFPLHPYPSAEAPSFSVNAPGTPVAHRTWGEVKALFQP